MSRKQQSTLTFAVKLQLPEGANGSSAQAFLRAAISSYGGGLVPDDPFFNVKAEDFTVRLLKKEVQYLYG